MAKPNSNIANFDSICRSCLTTDGCLKSIFNGDPFLDLPALLNLFASVQVSDMDGLPGQVCEQCFAKLISFRDFRDVCRRSDDYLKLCASKKSTTNHCSVNNDDEFCVDADPSFWSFNKVDKLGNNPDDESICTRNGDDVDNENLEKERRKIKKTSNVKENTLLLLKKKKTKIKRLKKEESEHVDCSVNVISNFDKEGKNEHMCNICCKNVSSKEELKTHKCLHYSYTCKLCQSRFKNMQYFRSHACKPVNETNLDNDKTNLGKQKNSHCIKMLICHLCEHEFKNITRLQYHIRSHTGEKPALCTWCGKGFREQRGLINHIRAVHTGEKRFKCSFCPKAFPVSGKRKQHERVHTGEKPYQCDLCNRLFAAKTTLNTHRRLHTGENKFKCKVQGCNQGFYAFSTYQRHMWAHRGERPYPCLECNKTYLSAQNLRSHVKAAHTKLRDEICHMCGKGFTEKSVLNRHLRKIHNIEPKDNRPIAIYGTSTEIVQNKSEPVK